MLQDCLHKLYKHVKKITLNSCFLAFVIPPSPYSQTDINTLKKHFLSNITPQGAVMASPSQSHPNYYFHWVRDAAITMSLVEDWYEQDNNPNDKKRLKRYVDFVNTTQHAIPTPGYELLGEPKYYLDGTVYTGAWGRPQNDGPALRAITLIRFANTLLASPTEENYVTTHLYAPSLDYDAMGAIKRDLEYVASHWRNKSVDLWEESTGYHYFTSTQQKLALQMGARLAKRLNDPDASHYYDTQAKEVDSLLSLFIDHDMARLKASILQEGPDKTGNIDSSILLSLLDTALDDELDDSIIQNTVKALLSYFKQTYKINDGTDTILIGRYPNDTYDGYETNQLGNPWPLLTSTLAHYYYRLAHHYVQTHDDALAKQMIEKGDAILKRLKHYTSTLHLSEQLNRDTGVAQGANDLTWSYQALLKALEARKKVISA